MRNYILNIVQTGDTFPNSVKAYKILKESFIDLYQTLKRVSDRDGTSLTYAY